MRFGGALFGGSLKFLRFEANLLFSPLGSYSLELPEGFVEGSFVCGLVAQEEGELPIVDDLQVCVEARLLEA